MWRLGELRPRVLCRLGCALRRNVPTALSDRQSLTGRRLIGELRNLKILDMTKPLDLEALYVQLQVREEDPPRYLKDEDVGDTGQWRS